MSGSQEEEPIRQIMFERKFHVQDLRKRILLHVFEPRLEPDGWVCEYQLIVPGLARKIFVPVAGVDKLDSVTSAIRRIRSDLALVAERLGRSVTWLGEPRLDLI